MFRGDYIIGAARYVWQVLMGLRSKSLIKANPTRWVLLPVLLPLLMGTPAPAKGPSTEPMASVPVSSLVSRVTIPWESFTLANGLRVVVHTDRKAPIVGVSVWYHVGSKDEPAGKTGFAHLFEHLMFNGSEHAPGDFFQPMQVIGATDMNGTTSFDRTNYFETVPTAGLERALFLESDRMGYLLGGMTQAVLDNQRGVVQNEKRQNDNEPYGLVQYAQLDGLFPEGHPYRHSTIGSMTDLDGASLNDVKNWFRAKYGPNNAVLVLAGDIDVATAKPLVEKYFGEIAKGPDVSPAQADVPTLAAPKSIVLKDRVATTRIMRMWAVPGLLDPDLVPLDIAVTALGGLSSSRLDNALVRDEKLAVGVSAGIQAMERVSILIVSADVRPGVDPAAVNRRIDEIIAEMIAKGPTADELQRVAAREVTGRIAGLEAVGGFGGKAVSLAEGMVYANDPDFYRKQLNSYAVATPEQARAAAARWMIRPAFTITVVPGERPAYDEAKTIIAKAPPAIANVATGEVTPEPRSITQLDRSVLPPVGPDAPLHFPPVQRATLKNGIEVIYAQRGTVPATRIAIAFDAGHAADPKAKLGTQSLMLSLLDEGTTSRNSIQIAEAQERLGANISVSAAMDRTTVGLFALTPNLAPSLDLMADVIRHPAFAPQEVERVKAQQLARIEGEMRDPGSIALRLMPPLLYGPNHAYGVPFTGTGDPAIVAKLTRDDLVAFQQAWLRPEKAKIFVVSDAPLPAILSALNAALGDWKAIGPPGTKQDQAAPLAPRPRIVLVDRPGSPQSLILGGAVLPLTGTDELSVVIAANDVLGGDFLSRLNSDLRETKGWAYGVSARFSRVDGRLPYLVSAPVQADRTGDSIAALLAGMKSFLTTDGMTAEERERSITGKIRELPGSFEGASDVLSGMQRNYFAKRPDNYYDGLADRYRAMTVADLDKAARAAINPDALLWVVVGDSAKIRPQLEKLGLPIEQAGQDR